VRPENLAQTALKRVPYLAEASPAGLARLADRCLCRQLDRGQLLFLEGEPVTHFFVVERGWIRVYKSGPRGQKQLVLHMEGPGSSVAEVAVFLEEERYPASAEAVEPSEVIAVSREALFELMEAEPAVARAVARYLAARQRELLRLVSKLTFQDVLERLVFYLVERLEADGQGFELPTNAELAGILGTVPEIVSRKLWQLYREGLIELDGRRVRVTEPAYLLAKFWPRRSARRGP